MPFLIMIKEQLIFIGKLLGSYEVFKDRIVFNFHDPFDQNKQYSYISCFSQSPNSENFDQLYNFIGYEVTSIEIQEDGKTYFVFNNGQQIWFKRSSL